jgi:hypothetical protein
MSDGVLKKHAKCPVLRVCERSGVPLPGARFEEELWTE